jgi:hypothetical protein
MNYFLSIVLDNNGRYTYRLAKGTSIRDCIKLMDISRRGAQQWFKEHKRRTVYNNIRAAMFAEEGETKPRIFFVNRAFQFYE